MDNANTTAKGQQMTTSQVIALARKNIPADQDGTTSARFCLHQAVSQYDALDFDAARMWARKSLSYSVGMFHADFVRASK